jgi:hypothetical protein
MNSFMDCFIDSEETVPEIEAEYETLAVALEIPLVALTSPSALAEIVDVADMYYD